MISEKLQKVMQTCAHYPIRNTSCLKHPASSKDFSASEKQTSLAKLKNGQLKSKLMRGQAVSFFSKYKEEHYWQRSSQGMNFP